MENLARLRRLRGFILDMDGVLYRGHTPLSGAREFITHLEEKSIPYLLATNNSTQTPEVFAQRLQAMGLPIPLSRILTSAQAAAMYLAQKLPPGSPAYALGGPGVREALLAQGFSIAEDNAQAVVVGMDRDLTYERLKAATLLILQGAMFIGTNPDATYPTEEGLVPGAGALLAALEVASGQKPTVIGKPEPTLFRLALERLGTQPPETGCIGDRLETDILGGHRAGLTTILTLSGVAQREDLVKAPVQPDFVFEDLAELDQALF